MLEFLQLENSTVVNEAGFVSRIKIQVTNYFKVEISYLNFLFNESLIYG